MVKREKKCYDGMIRTISTRSPITRCHDISIISTYLHRHEIEIIGEPRIPMEYDENVSPVENNLADPPSRGKGTNLCRAHQP